MAPKKSFNVHVTSVEFEFDFSIDPNTTGKQLLDQVAKNVGIREIWYFGLRFTDSKNVTCWLRPDKKILSQDVQKEQKNELEVVQFVFLVRFFPEDVSELIEEITQRFFYRQVKNSILTDEIYCPPETCVLLASYAMQVKYEDYDENKHKPGMLTKERLLPGRVQDQFRLSNEEWEKRVMNWWREHKGFTSEDAMLEYLKIVQDLDMYGVTYFEIQNRNGTNLYLGIDALGINIYDTDDKLTPKIGFAWGEIRNITFNGKKFFIKPIDRSSPDFVFIVPRLRINRQMISLSMGNHELYMSRRTQETMELRQIKAQAEAKKLALGEQRERTKTEIERRKQVEQEREVLQRKIEELERSAQIARQEKPPRLFTQSTETESFEDQNTMKNEMENKRRQVEEAELRLQREREEDERKQQRMMERIQYEQQEKEKIVQEIEKTRLLAEENAQEAQRKENEARQIEEDLRETQMRVLQAQQQDNNHYTKQKERYQQPADDVETDEEDNSIGRNGQDVELYTDENIPHYVEKRTTVMSRDHSRKQKLEEERRNLQQQQQKADTREDKIYRENTIDRGIDKYKTLKKIREGTVKRRIDEFEAM
ncbi:unnamed protein product [Rotaria sordida]|uniref:FERM domain-containing protein n=1 Tax=Rotaria sordida TaxID=392033 RepID=A0A819ALP4_9BILA|nr:unnamed protein product [Rotaria sordida]